VFNNAQTSREPRAGTIGRLAGLPLYNLEYNLEIECAKYKTQRNRSYK